MEYKEFVFPLSTCWNQNVSQYEEQNMQNKLINVAFEQALFEVALLKVFVWLHMLCLPYGLSLLASYWMLGFDGRMWGDRNIELPEKFKEC